MNEKITELAVQADLYARSDNCSMFFEIYQKRYTDKFAGQGKTVLEALERVHKRFPGHEFVTVGLNQVVFHKSIPAGSILEFDTRLVKRGNTSATFNIDVFCNNRDNELVFTTEITFVAIDKDGNKTAIKERQ